MGWIPGVPTKPLPYTGQSFKPSACVMHRTIGKWGGDQAVLERGRVPSVHFLVGQDIGQWWQYYSTETTCAHAAGANGYAVGIEFSGQNSDVEELTDWQIECGAHLVQSLHTAHGIPRVFLERGPRVTGYVGFLNHQNVSTSPQFTHVDFITKAAWDRMVQPKPVPLPPQIAGEDMPTIYTIRNAGDFHPLWLKDGPVLIAVNQSTYDELAGQVGALHTNVTKEQLQEIAAQCKELRV